MTWEHIALWIPALICVVTCIYTAGVLTATVKSHEKRLNKHSDTHEKHTEKLAAHEVILEGHNVKLTTLTAWHQGFTAGTHRG